MIFTTVIKKNNSLLLSIFALFLFSSTIIANNATVALNHFTATEQDCGDVLLTWETSSEINNQVFKIRYSINGSKFEYVGKVSGSMNSNGILQYSFLHENVIEADLSYSLSAVGADNEETPLSKTEITTNCLNRVFAFQAPYPNPSINGVFAFDINVQNEVEPGRTFTANIYNSMGKLMQQNEISVQAGKNSTELNLSDFPNGIYILSITTNNETWTHSLVKI